MHLHSEELTWDSDRKSSSRNSSLRKKGRIPNLTIDELELYEPKTINTFNEMIIECEETEEGEFVNKKLNKQEKKLETLKQQRQLVDQMINKLKDSDEVSTGSFREQTNNKSIQEEKEDIILENQDEYMFGDS